MSGSSVMTLFQNVSFLNALNIIIADLSLLACDLVNYPFIKLYFFSY